MRENAGYFEMKIMVSVRGGDVVESRWGTGNAEGSDGRKEGGGRFRIGAQRRGGAEGAMGNHEWHGGHEWEERGRRASGSLHGGVGSKGWLWCPFFAR